MVNRIAHNTNSDDRSRDHTNDNLNNPSAGRRRSKTATIGSHALSKLSGVRIYNNEQSFVVYESIRSFLPFLMLPSMRYLYSKKILGHQQFNFPQLQQLIKMTRIKFDDNAIETRHIEGLLSTISGLQHFKDRYGNVKGQRMVLGNWKTARIVQALMEHHSGTLKSLNLTPRENIDARHMYGDQHFVDVLKNFRFLQSLRIDNHMLIKYSRTRATKEQVQQTVPRLCEILPWRLVKLTLVWDFGNMVAEKMLKGLAEWKERESAYLAEIVFEQDPGLYARTKERIKRADIKLVLKHED